MEKVNENDVKSCENNRNININTYKDNKVKLYKYCEKCGKDFETPSLEPFCNFECRQEYYQELRQDMTDVMNELMGRD